jgi:hypothetical protein
VTETGRVKAAEYTQAGREDKAESGTKSAKSLNLRRISQAGDADRGLRQAFSWPGGSFLSCAHPAPALDLPVPAGIYAGQIRPAQEPTIER